MKEILAKLLNVLKRFFCLFKLTLSCKLGFKDKEEEKKLPDTEDSGERN